MAHHQPTQPSPSTMASFRALTSRTLAGEALSFASREGQVTLVANVASA